MLCSRNNTLKVELPLLMKFTGARRHDSKNFLYAIDDFGRNAFGISPKNICLDSAHDNIPTYGLLEHWDINALIDINGRTVYIKNHAGLRFHPRIPKDSDQYKTIYGERTACERVNDRVLNDYCLQHLKIRGRDHFSFWTMLIGICIHLDARYKAAHLYTA